MFQKGEVDPSLQHTTYFITRADCLPRSCSEPNTVVWCTALFRYSRIHINAHEVRSYIDSWLLPL